MDTIGIDNISFYIPENRISIETIIKQRKKEGQNIYDSFINAQKTTHQDYLRLNKSWQDSVCLGAQAMLGLFENYNTRSHLEQLRYLVSATETPVDSAKPIAAYLLGILKKAYADAPSSILSYQTLHACAGGVISLLECATMMHNSSQNDVAVVVTTDIAHYESLSSAEITQGAGAVAFTITSNPRLLNLNIEHTGFFSSDVDDFFRPLGSHTAVVKGRYSMQCYIEASYHALLDFAKRKKKSLIEIIQESDYIVAHTPFASMPEIAFNYIFKKHLKLSSDKSQEFIESKAIALSASVIKDVGNTYTAAVFIPLGYLLSEKYKEIGNDIIGKKILLVSYGAGNNATVLELTVADQAAEIISNLNLDEQLENYKHLEFEKYEHWCESDITIAHPHRFDDPHSHPRVFLKEIRKDNYRLYDIEYTENSKQ